ncbi:hypothetical protein BJ123_13018 [Rhodopseudomonas thermotolerans]|uniref:Large polyvalent protein-associated domain-containing protein n=2 Tax=Rhodopseudomonas TaxID=1073 RepID=A0A336JWP6_9BRAD|nr:MULTISPECIES: LPD7 domain-containing protein [Rhodopseudomonas]RED25785.1 hypothetical protein BJ125_13018 [Rhodopseudomonas pentothenatexigens]REF90414.1 hypothetical protein BJ123_13018 [Rhodopseudomonas thermotolerans]SSW93113.1 hypothetical protein SAMN05892882_13018 [Rhodopseudomonas pentothenatexigens]
MAEIKAQNFKAKLLSEIAPEGFDVHAFTLDLRMIKKPAPGKAARIMTTDGGWIEYDSVRRSVRTWGPIGRAQILAGALAAKVGCEVQHLAKSTSVAAHADALKVTKAAEDTVKSLVIFWSMRGYNATGGPDGCWVNAGTSRICDTGDRLDVHGGLTDEAIAAVLVKARDSWDGGMCLDGDDWTQAEQDRLWIAAQRAGVEVRNCEPSDAIRSRWQREHETAAKTTKTFSSAKSAIAVAGDVRNAAAGDLAALNRLPKALQAFVVAHLDDEQRSQLSAKSIADITAALKRFGDLGETELQEFERAGREFTPPNPRRDNHDREAGYTYSR